MEMANGGQWESGAGAPALQDLTAPRTRRVNAKRHGVRNASSALAGQAFSNTTPTSGRPEMKLLR